MPTVLVIYYLLEISQVEDELLEVAGDLQRLLFVLPQTQAVVDAPKLDLGVPLLPARAPNDVARVLVETVEVLAHPAEVRHRVVALRDCAGTDAVAACDI